MVAKMGLAKEPGQKELMNFLIQIGVPIEQAKQQYAYMNPEIRNKIRHNIMEISDKFGLNDITMASYSRQFNSQMQLSATDCAYAATSLLESPNTQSSKE